MEIGRFSLISDRAVAVFGQFSGGVSMETAPFFFVNFCFWDSSAVWPTVSTSNFGPATKKNVDFLNKKMATLPSKDEHLQSNRFRLKNEERYFIHSSYRGL